MGKGLPQEEEVKKMGKWLLSGRLMKEEKNLKDNRKQVSHCERKDLKYVE